MSWFEKKFSRYAISNLSLMLIICYAFGYLIERVNVSFINYLTLNPYLILRGQVWRLFTWIVIPPAESNLFFMLIMLYFYYSIGTSLERTWGIYRYNVYIFGGMLFTILGSFLLMGSCYIFRTDSIAYYGAAAYFQMVSLYTFSTYYINMSIFLAYAVTFPDMVVLLMFIFPVKVKWLGIVYGALLVFECIQGGFYTWFAIGASLLNFLIFFMMSRNRVHMSPKQKMRQAAFRKEVKRPANMYGGVSKHKCAICGRTEITNPELTFRFCTKCEGNYEYCQEHLFTHTHVKKQ
ncbi:MAG: hypothetical protein PHP50_14140 [Lachnospiraceae bacterium]|nr:hypothetical protein [Lachnospiraceae bacterium]